MIPSQVLLRVDVRGYHPGVVARLLHLCRLGLDGAVPDHSTFSKNRHGRFRDSDLLRKVFATTVERCIAEGLVGGEGFAVDASMIKADANCQRSVPGTEGLPTGATNHAAREYLAVLDDAALVGPRRLYPSSSRLPIPPRGGPAPTVAWHSSPTARTT
jgi:hypothetical protein